MHKQLNKRASKHNHVKNLIVDREADVQIGGVHCTQVAVLARREISAVAVERDVGSVCVSSPQIRSETNDAAGCELWNCVCVCVT